MVKDHSDNEREETRCRHMGYSFQLAEGFFYKHYPTARIALTTGFVTPVVEHWLKGKVAQWIYHEELIRRSIAPRSDDLSRMRYFKCCGVDVIIWTDTSLTVWQKEMFYLTTHSTHFIYGYMASDIWLRTILIVRKETPYAT